jgi:DNA primase
MDERGGRWPEGFVRAVRERADIVAVVSEAVALRRAGRNLVGLCPFHEERTPSFTVSPERGVFHCFGCQAGGDVITFVMRREGLDFRAAVLALAERFGVPVPERPRSPAEERAERQRREALRCCEFAAAYYHQALAAAPAALAYLRGRGVSDESIARWRLGYAGPAWDGLARALRRAGIALEVAAQVGLVARRASGDGYYDVFRDRIMFPIADERGAVVAFGGRTLGQDPRKYLNSRESPLFAKRRTWYGWHLARSAVRSEGRVIVVEGYLDAVMAHQHGFATAVASLGTALSREQAGILTRHAEEILVAYDADAAGAAATWRGLLLLQGSAARVRVVDLPAGQDPDAWLRAAGREPFARAVDNARPLIEYLVETVAARHDLTRLEERAAAAREVVPLLAGITDPVERDLRARQAGRLLLLDDAETLVAGVRRHLAEKGEGYRNRTAWHPTTDRRNAAVRKLRSGRVRAQEGVLRQAGRDREAALAAMAEVGPEDFDPGPYRSLAEALWAVAPQVGDQAPLAAVLDRETDEGIRALAARLLAGGEDAEPEWPLADCIAYLRRVRLERRLDEVRAAQQALERAGRAVPEDMMRETAALRQAIAELKAGAPGRFVAGRGSSGHG